VDNDLLVVLEVESTYSKKILCLQIIGISIGAVGKDSQSLLELIILHQLFPLVDSFTGRRFASSFFAALLEDRIKSC
jgi:hypothetical protein